MDNNLFHVCYKTTGVSSFDNNDSMMSVSTSADTSAWEKFDYETANVVKSLTGWRLVQIVKEEK